MKKIYSVLLAFRLGYSSNRSFLTGISRYLRSAPNWRAHVCENFYDFSEDLAESVRNGDYDGMITVAPHDPSARKRLKQAKLPLVLIGHGPDMPGRTRNITFIQCDDHAIGARAARHFTSLGKFRSFAFVMSIPVVKWAEMRLSGFSDALSQLGFPVVPIVSRHPVASEDDIAFLSQQIARLPKPAAVFATYDQRAVQVLQACTSGGIAVPREVQIIGVDDDPIFCDFCHPTLTSISTNQVRAGEVAAMELERMMSHGGCGLKFVTLRNAEVVERESTAPISPAATLVNRALSYIERHATEGISSRNVVAYLGVSQALVSRRFRELEGRSLSQAIVRARLKAVRSKLRSSKLNIAAITRQCGFENADYAKRVFKKVYGQTMRDYRKR